MKKPSKEEIKKAMEAAYKQVGVNSFFGQGFNSGAEWVYEQLQIPKSVDDNALDNQEVFRLAVAEYCKESESDGFLFGPEKNGCSLEKSNGYNAGLVGKV